MCLVSLSQGPWVRVMPSGKIYYIALANASWVLLVNLPYFPLTLEYTSSFLPPAPHSFLYFPIHHLPSLSMPFFPPTAQHWELKQMTASLVFKVLTLQAPTFSSSKSQWHWWAPLPRQGSHTLSPYQSLLGSALVFMFQAKNSSCWYQYSAGIVSCPWALLTQLIVKDTDLLSMALGLSADLAY